MKVSLKIIRALLFFSGFVLALPFAYGSCPVENVGDNFFSVSYGQNSGSQNWSGSWTEIGESDGTSAGIARVRNDLCTSENCLRLGVPSGGSAETYNNRGVYRETNLSSVSSATLSFVFRSGVNQGNQTVVLSISNNGGTSWTDLQSYVINSTNISPTSESFDISAYAASNTQIRFLASGNNAVIGTYIDDINISYQPVCPPPTPLLEYRFEEVLWNGTPGEIIDHTGNGYNAQVNHSSLLERTSPALSGSLGTCGYASQNDGSIQVTGLPLDTTTDGVKTTVTFWMNWDGTESVMPIGWDVHDIWLVSGSMGFNTGSGDVYGISSAGLANGWHHVAVEFTNGSVTNNRMHIDGVEQVLTQRQNTPNNSRAVVHSELRIGGWAANSSYDFHGSIDEVRVYEGILTTSQVNTVMAERHTCPSTPVAEYRFDELEWDGVTNDVLDSSGNALHGQSQGTSPTDGLLCNAANFNRSNRIEVANNVLLEVGDNNADYTVNFWLNPRSTTAGWSNILHKGSTNLERTFSAWFFPGASRITPAISTTSDSNEFHSTVASIGLNSWTMITFVKQGNQLMTYFNGTLEIQTTLVGSSLSNSGPLYIGDDPWYTGIDALMDELVIFDGALSTSEIQAIRTHNLDNKGWDGSQRNCPGPAIPLLEYRFEESSWDGSAGEIIDHTGNGYNAQVNNNSIPEIDSPAIPTTVDNLGTCGYASQNDGSIQVTGLPLDTTTIGVKTTVTFWMNWDGTESAMPIGWDVHDIWIVSGSMGFNTGAGDVYGTSSAGLANGWHHVAVEFTNGSVTNNRMHIDGVEQVLTQRQSTPNNSRAVVDSELRIGGWAINSSYDFHGLIDEVRVYEGILTTAQIVTIMGETHACDTTPVHHYEISHDGQGLTCEAENVTIKACTNESCSTSNLSTQPVTLDLLANGLPISSPTFTGSTTISVSNTNVETLTLSVADATLAASNLIVCDDGSATSCDLVFDNTGFKFLVDGDSVNIPIQLSGKPSNEGYNSSNLSLQAIKTNTETGACEAALVNLTNVEITAECINPLACAGEQVLINSTKIETQNDVAVPSSYTSVSLDFGSSDNNIANFNLTYPDAGKVQLHARYNIPVDGILSGDYMQGSSNSFVVRPFGFYIEAVDNPKAEDSGGSVYKKAGEEFVTDVIAIQWQFKDDSDNDGIPDEGSDLTDNNPTQNFGNEIVSENVILEHKLQSPLDGLKGDLSGAVITDFNLGKGSTNLSWSEVGIISLTANLNSSPYIDANSITGSIPYVGRFIPAYFLQTVKTNGTLNAKHSLSGTCSVNDWAYSGQETDGKGTITYGLPPEILITAYNTSDVITTNYTTSGFMKLDKSDITVSPPTEDFDKIRINPEALDEKINIISKMASGKVTPALDPSGKLIPGVLSYEFNSGDHFIYEHNTHSKYAPFPAKIPFVVTQVEDEDKINLYTGIDETIIPTAPVLTEGVEIRFGRLVLKNNFGPETSSLSLPMQIEHFVGDKRFVVSDDNNCTRYDVAKMTRTKHDFDHTLPDVLGDQDSFIKGETDSIQLKAPGAGKQGTINVTYDAYDWLKYDWFNDGNYDGIYNDNPSAIATFGIFRGNDRIIYWREVFNE